MPKKQCIGKTFHVGSHLVTVEDVIAEGGFALVFLTRDSHGRRFALKRMYVNTEQDVLMCQQEIHILEALGKEPDSYIVRFYASTINVIDEEVREVLILLEYYKYSVLQLMNERFQAKRHLAEEEVLNIFSDICHAVGKLHTHRPAWTHRDLKVENILIDKDGRCVLCDFGSATSRVLDPLKQSIAEIEEDLKKYTTIAYRAPEMVNLYGFKKAITLKADIWALGVLLYKMCYFTLPFGESSLAIQNCNLQFPSTPSYSAHLMGLIRYCLKVNPDDRPDIFQVASVSSSLAKRECLVPNLNRCVIVAPDSLLSIPENNQVVPAPPVETSPPRVLRPAGGISTQEFSSTTSIAPRERPKASTPASGLVLLPSLNLKLASNIPSTDAPPPKTIPLSSRPGSNLPATEGPLLMAGDTTSPFRPVAGAVNPFRPPPFQRPDVVARPTRMGHRRNTSDTSTMVPTTRPLSPTPTQNISEKSRSADTSPSRLSNARSPNPGVAADKNFSNWNPFEDAEMWQHAPAASVSTTVQGLAQSLSSLVRGGSVSSASRTTISSPTGGENNGERPKIKAQKGAGAVDVKKEKKKFRYQKFDNDSEEELMPSDGVDDLSAEPPTAMAAGRRKPANATSEKGKDKGDTDSDGGSIGSASDLKHEDDTTDDERTVGQPGLPARPSGDHDKTEEEDNGAGYDSVQYGTLEETASAIQSIVSHKSILQETSSKPLLENAFDKSDDDELEERDRPAQASAPAQRRLTFESMGLLSVFDQIPFRYPKKSKTFAALKTLDSPTSVKGTESRNTEVAFAETNPFSSNFSSNTLLPSGDSSHDFENIADRDTTGAFVAPAKLPLPPPVPPKPTFLRKDIINGSGLKHPPPQSAPHPEDATDIFGSFDGPSYMDDGLDEALVSLASSHREHGGSSSSNNASKSARKNAKSPLFQESLPLFTSTDSAKLSKSPTARRSRRIQEGVCNISFEDA